MKVPAPHTPGPWRWEINRKSKSLHLVGGRPMYDLTLLDFERWGMGGATIRLRDTAHDGLQIMHKVHERPDWIAPFKGREHHASWCADIVHPDAQLIACAPDLLGIAVRLSALYGKDDVRAWMALRDDARAAIAKATGQRADIEGETA